MNKVLFSKLSDHWSTPKWLYDIFMNNGFIDPCPLHSKKNNLDNIYHNKNIFINPPYSDIKSWVDFIKRNVKDNVIALLIPARTDTIYFHKLLELNPKIIFIKGRLKFSEIGTAPFPSIIMVFNNYVFRRYDSVERGAIICQ